ncbi:MAG: hypothetical protein ACI9HY_002866 [Planctomycetaceae bacterium]|jgi:hypothetical protein
MSRLRVLVLLFAMVLSAQTWADIPRTASGKPDLSGVYDTGILTPTQRPDWLGETVYLYPWVARLLNWTFRCCI